MERGERNGGWRRRGDTDIVIALAGREATVILAAYLLAGLPVGAALLAGRASPLYRLPLAELARWWSRMALALVLGAFVFARL